MTVRILTGDCREVLAGMAKGSVHTVVTSPPYFGLRNYGHADQIGAEPTPEAFVAALVEVMRGAWRVLREDGVAWVVLGDSYAGSWGNYSGQNRGNGTQRDVTVGSLKVPAWEGREQERPAASRPEAGTPGQLLLIPARVALALQADGWILRQVVTWCKPAPMPESVAGTRWERCRVKVAPRPVPVTANKFNGDRGDGGVSYSTGRAETSGVQAAPRAEFKDCPGCPRCAATDGYVLRRGSWRHTSATEQVLMLVKNLGYWADQEAVREAAAYEGDNRALRMDLWKTVDPMCADGGSRLRTGNPTAGRNPRNWTSPPPAPFSAKSVGIEDVDHFAVYPAALIEPLIRATCPAKCCPVCGAGYAPVVEREAATPGQAPGWAAGKGTLRNDGARAGRFVDQRADVLGHRPTCACNTDAAPVPGVCLDPFAGAGTTGLVADRLGLDCIGIELNPDYARIAEARLRADAGMFAEVTTDLNGATP